MRASKVNDNSDEDEEEDWPAEAETSGLNSFNQTQLSAGLYEQRKRDDKRIMLAGALMKSTAFASKMAGAGA